jgi:hypothetical protein
MGQAKGKQETGTAKAKHESGYFSLEAAGMALGAENGAGSSFLFPSTGITAWVKTWEFMAFLGEFGMVLDSRRGAGMKLLSEHQDEMNCEFETSFLAF